MSNTALYYQYWGKAKPEAGDGPAYHLLPYHCLDVAAVGWALLEKNPQLLEHFARLSGIEKQVLKPVLIFFLVLHDLGKFSESFQNIIPGLLESLQGITNSKKQPYSKKAFGHDSIGYLIWKSCVFRQVTEHYQVQAVDDWREILNWFMEASNGHHGLPVKQEKKSVNDFYNENDKQAVEEFTKDCFEIFSIKELFDDIDLDNSYEELYENLPQASWLFTGFYVLCDWIGSGSKFKYYSIENKFKLKDYWDEIAFKTAKEAILEAGILPCQTNSELDPLTQLLDLPASAELTPLQNLVKMLDIQQSPQLFIIEDETGAGKTEASLILLNRLMAKGLAEGFYLALPSMATADGIYPRVQKTYDKLYKYGEKPSLVLSHSSAKLSDKFTDTILYFDKAVSEQKYSDDAQSRCQAWLADNRKKSLLSQVGVGTIDQAFLAVLKVKYQSLRLIGLVGKVLVIDEAHAYDSYMGKELEVLVEVHAALGGSAIVMSATLPLNIREKLTGAFQKGLNSKVSKLVEKNAYPLLTHIAADYKKEIPCLNNPNKSRKLINYQFVHQEEDVNELIKISLEQGKCVCWIRNSVKDARNSYQQWKHRENADLFHARFVLSDRLTVQEKIMGYFDKSSSAEKRRGRLLIATQVVEQSLDLDFDVMITDLAPIDLMLQRAGRLHRHVRDQYGSFKQNGEDERSDAVLTIFCPEYSDNPNADWYSTQFPNAKWVYKNHARLWAGMKQLMEIEARIIPQNIRPLVEAVYGEQCQIPKGLRASDIKACGNASAERSNAGFNTIDFECGYTLDGQVWAEDLDMPTRLGEETLTLTLAKWDGEHLLPFGKPDKQAWQKSEIRVLAKNVSQILPATEAQQQSFEQIKPQLPSQGKWVNLLPMSWNDEKQLWEGLVLNGKHQETPIYYCSMQGLIYAYEMEQVQQDDQLETEETL